MSPSETKGKDMAKKPKYFVVNKKTGIIQHETTDKNECVRYIVNSQELFGVYDLVAVDESFTAIR
jgi:hypothetical protein